MDKNQLENLNENKNIFSLKNSVKDLLENNIISARTYNICVDNNIKTLLDLYEYYVNNRSFEFRNCGLKTTLELRNVIEQIKLVKFQESFVANNITHCIEINVNNAEIKIEKLREQKKISNTTFKFCSKYKIRTLSDLLNFSKKQIEYNFIKIPSKLRIDLENLNNSNCTNILLNNYMYFDEDKKEIIKLNYESLISKLSVRSINGLKSIDEELNIEKILFKIFEIDFYFENIKSIGIKSLHELEGFKLELKSLIEKISLPEFNNLDAVKLEIETKFAAKFNDDKDILIYDELSNFKNAYITNDNKIRLFYLINFFIQFELLFLKSDFKNKILKYISSNTHFSNTSIANDLSLSSERVRQIKVELNNNFGNIFYFFLKRVNIKNTTLNHLINLNYFFIDNEEVSKINLSEDVNFNLSFYKNFIKIYLKDSFCIVDFNKTSINKDDSEFIFLHKNIYASFDFKKFLNEFDIFLNENRTEDYNLNFHELINSYKINNIDEKIIYDILKEYIEKYYDLKLDSDSNILLVKNKEKSRIEILEEIFNLYNKPMNIYEIQKVLESKYSGIFLNIETIRSTILLNKSIFISIGKSSTYGLKKWEFEKKDIKGGTIRTIVGQLLLEHDTPMHIVDIFNYISIYRPKTTLKSVMTNLELSNSFNIFPNYYIGLKHKNYNENQINISKINGTFFSLNNLKKFNNFSINEITEYFKNKYSYDEKQVEFIISEKINKGEITKTKQGKIVINKFKPNIIDDCVFTISNEIIESSDEFHLTIKNMITENKILDSIQLCFEIYNANYKELNFKDYFVIINEVKNRFHNVH
jgi:hypothetical protein